MQTRHFFLWFNRLVECQELSASLKKSEHCRIILKRNHSPSKPKIAADYIIMDDTFRISNFKILQGIVDYLVDYQDISEELPIP